MWRLEGNKDMYPSLSKKVQIIACRMHCVSEFQKILQSTSFWNTTPQVLHLS